MHRCIIKAVRFLVCATHEADHARQPPRLLNNSTDVVQYWRGQLVLLVRVGLTVRDYYRQVWREFE